MPVLDDFQCKKCGFTDELFREVNAANEEKDCPNVGCDGKMIRLIPVPTINDSSSATFIVKPAEYKHMIRTAKTEEKHKGTKDKKKKKELQEAARELQKHRS